MMEFIKNKFNAAKNSFSFPNIKLFLVKLFNNAKAFVKNFSFKKLMDNIDNAILKFASSFNVIEDKFTKKEKANGQR